MIFCRDCKHCDLGKKSTPPPGWPQGRALHWWCELPPIEYDPVSGNVVSPTLQQCHARRAVGGACGPDAKLFEARTTS